MEYTRTENQVVSSQYLLFLNTPLYLTFGPSHCLENFHLSSMIFLEWFSKCDLQNSILALPGNLFNIQSFWLLPKNLLNQKLWWRPNNLWSNKISRWFWCSVQILIWKMNNVLDSSSFFSLHFLIKGNLEFLNKAPNMHPIDRVTCMLTL